jgi:hypothetical protein
VPHEIWDAEVTTSEEKRSENLNEWLGKWAKPSNDARFAFQRKFCTIPTALRFHDSGGTYYGPGGFSLSFDANGEWTST